MLWQLFCVFRSVVVFVGCAGNCFSSVGGCFGFALIVGIYWLVVLGFGLVIWLV